MKTPREYSIVPIAPSHSTGPPVNNLLAFAAAVAASVTASIIRSLQAIPSILSHAPSAFQAQVSAQQNGCALNLRQALEHAHFVILKRYPSGAFNWPQRSGWSLSR